MKVAGGLFFERLPGNRVVAEAPSNIALIKYMGKVKGAEKNRPTNRSFSFTLSSLRTRVEIEPINDSYDIWQPLVVNGWIGRPLSEWGRKRYLAHFEFLKQKLGVSGKFRVSSANNFPADCGIASSASSFAALTVATYELARSQNPNLEMSLPKIAELSRLGSGSSIRSFIEPFAMWGENGVEAVELPYSTFLHQVVIVDKEKKAIGSTEAHQMVPTSLLFHGRPERAEARLESLIGALREKRWADAHQICNEEFWDMHALFMTSRPAFSYIRPNTIATLEVVEKYWRDNQDGPLVTMDAGANVHLLYRPEQTACAQKIAELLKNFEILKSYE